MIHYSDFEKRLLHRLAQHGVDVLASPLRESPPELLPARGRPGALKDKVVEVHGLDGPLKVQSGPLSKIGEDVEANGLRGWAVWEEGWEDYALYTCEGLCLRLPGANLKELEAPEKGELQELQGHFDVAWPYDAHHLSLDRSRAIVEAVWRKGYCVLQSFDHCEDELIRAARSLDSFTLPKPEFEESFLGRGNKSKVLWLEEGFDLPDDGSWEALDKCTGRANSLAASLAPLLPGALGFTPWRGLCRPLLRAPIQHASERRALSPEALDEAAIRSGRIAEHLDFVQRRKLCIMYFLECEGGCIDFFPKDDLNEPSFRVSVSKNQFVIFRQDLLGYTYYAGGGADELAFQAWVVEEPQRLALQALEGDQRSAEAVFGGPPQAPEDQVHVMSAGCRLPGCGTGIDKMWLVPLLEVDSHTEIPFDRWDNSLYYTSESGQFATGGLSVTKHCGHLEHSVLLGFDNEFFGIEEGVANNMAPSHRILLECSYEAFFLAGHTRTTLRGLPVFICNGECDSSETDSFYGYQRDPDNWRKGCARFNISSGARLSYQFGLMGAVQTVDTACSSTLVSANILHSSLRKKEHASTKFGLSMGHQINLSPFVYIGLSGAGMIGRTGRSLTFNETANGFGRGEGVGGITMKVSGETQATQDRLAAYVSSYLNQDGRSASLTAPNGPSQQAAIRGSLRQANLDPQDISCQENHGTGTALGDPIETGSIEAVFRRRVGALPVTACKSNFGHLETTAGSVSLMKLICSLIHSTAPANCHLGIINANIGTQDVPGFFPIEAVTFSQNEHAIGGLNAFGFGGTNSHAELWALGHKAADPRELVSRGRRGLRMDKIGSLTYPPRELERLDMVTVVCPSCMGPMCWLCGVAASQIPKRGKHVCGLVRDEFASYERCSQCYEGSYQYGVEAGVPIADIRDRGQRLYLVGTWSAWSTFHELIETSEDVYSGEFELGETCVEQFHIVLDKDHQKVIVPAVVRAGPSARISEPCADRSRHWLVDGRRDGLPPGTRYEVSFAWSDTEKAIAWWASPKVETEKESSAKEGSTSAESSRYQHSYSIIGSLTGGKPEDLSPSTEIPNCWEWTGKLRKMRDFGFHLMRDHDPRQLIYPLTSMPSDSSVPVMGPDEGGMGKDWPVPGRSGDNVQVQLCFEEGDIKVEVTAPGLGSMRWRSLPGPCREVYSVMGSWSGFASTRMEAVTDVVYKAWFTIGPGGREEFQLLVNESEDLRFYPASAHAAPGEAPLCGPDGKGEELLWQVVGPPNQWIEIMLNLGAQDRSGMVTCRTV